MNPTSGNLLRSIMFCVTVFLMAGLNSPGVIGQAVDSSADGSSTQGVTREQFDRTMQQWKDKYKEAWNAISEFEHIEEHLADDLANRIRRLKAEGDALANKAIDEAAELYRSSAVGFPDLKVFLDGLPDQFFDSHGYERSFRVGRSLLRHDPENIELLHRTALSAFFANEFQSAETLMERIQRVLGISAIEDLPPAFGFASDIPKCKDRWEREVQLREQEALADDLPRIEIDTPRGQIVFELFENEAYDAVSSLVHLIETDYFQNMNFCDVQQHGFALTGCPFNNGTGGPDYGVRSEAKEPNARSHFRGSVAMRVDDLHDTVGSQFYICRVPNPNLDGVNVVVGRVVEGMDIVDQLTTTHTMDDRGNRSEVPDAVWDRLLSIRVARKRDHEYRANKVETTDQ